MNRIIVAILLALLSTNAFSSQQTILSTDNVGQQRTKINANSADLEARKADKDKTILDWSAHADGTTFVAKVLVAYDGQIYKCLQSYTKNAGDTPAAFTSYWKAVGGVSSYNDLDDKPTLGTAAAQNVGTSVGNIPQIGSDGKIPSGIYTSNGLSSQPTDTGQSIVSSGASAYSWLPNVPLTTNPSGLINSGGTLDLSGFQPLDPALTAAAGLDGSGANKMIGTNIEGSVGVINIPGKPTVQAAPPTTSNTEGLYCDSTGGKCYYRSLAGIFDLASGTYTPDPTQKTLTVTPPANGTIICNDQALSQSISCPGVCTASAPTDTAIVGIIGQGDQGYTCNGFTGDITGPCNAGTVTLSSDKTGSATFTSTALWAIDDPFTTDTASTYTRISGTTATLAVDTVTGKAYNSYANSTGYFAHPTDIGSVNMVAQAVLTERKNSTTAGGSAVVINTDGVSIGYGVWVNAVNSRLSFVPLGGVGTEVLKSFAPGAWAADASHLVQITRNGTTATIEINFNDDDDFLDANEQVGTVTLSALVNGTKAGVGFNYVQAADTVDNFRAKAL